MYYKTLNELTGYRQFEEFTLQQYLQSLVDKHKIKVANGNFSVVLIPEDKPYVYKIWSDDKGFDTWIGYCSKNQGEYSLIPKIYGKIKELPHLFIRGDEYTNTKLKIAKIEKLSDCVSMEVDYHYADTDDIRRTDFVYCFSKKLENDELELDDDGFCNLKEIFDYAPKILHSLKQSSGCSYDIMKLDNYAMRNNADVVITDPFWDMNCEEQFTIPSMMDNTEFIFSGNNDNKPQPKSKLIVGKDGKSYTGNNEQALSTLSYNWKRYADSNYTDNIISNAYSRSEAHSFVKSTIDYFDNKINIDVNDAMYKSFQNFLLHILRRSADVFSKFIHHYYGPFPKVLATIDLSSYDLRTVDMLFSTSELRRLTPTFDSDSLLLELDRFVYSLYSKNKNHYRNYIEEYIDILRDDTRWQNKPQSLEIDNINFD
jgi:hypothetical protein